MGSQDTLPLPPVICPIPLGSVPLSPKSGQGAVTVSVGCHPQHMGLKALLRQPWERLSAFPWLDYGVVLPAIVSLGSFVPVEMWSLSHNLEKEFCQTWIWSCTFVAETWGDPINNSEELRTNTCLASLWQVLEVSLYRATGILQGKNSPVQTESLKWLCHREHNEESNILQEMRGKNLQGHVLRTRSPTN